MTLKGSGPAERIYFSQRLRLHYVDWASRRASATPRPRRTGHCRNWDWVAAALRYDWHLLAPDLRGHGDSQWSPDGNYTIAGYVYDLTQLIHQQELAPLTMKRGVAERMQDWIAEQRALSGRTPLRLNRRRFQTHAGGGPSPVARSGAASHPVWGQPERGRHLQLEIRQLCSRRSAYEMTVAEIEELWRRITCPTLLVYGKESCASDPVKDGRARHFRDAKVVAFENAGHWVHHDRLDAFLDLVRGFSPSAGLRSGASPPFGRFRRCLCRFPAAARY